MPRTGNPTDRRVLSAVVYASSNNKENWRTRRFPTDTTQSLDGEFLIKTAVVSSLRLD